MMVTPANSHCMNILYDAAANQKSVYRPFCKCARCFSRKILDSVPPDSLWQLLFGFKWEGHLHFGDEMRCPPEEPGKLFLISEIGSQVHLPTS